MSKKHIDENGFTVNEGHTENLDFSFLDFGGRIDNVQAESSFGLSPDLFRRNREREIRDEFEQLCDGVES